ncbi:MAG: putative manganese-dependent inorganic diphosphatase [Sphaerochaetaceae bacterium]|nr:putative manganese-dependent inorganic diphosphatase [Sphaerochaetaceae bacterium]
MKDIFITGHRNPDMDSICAALSYANLKNIIDSKNNYIPIRCGHLSDSAKKWFSFLNIVPPVYKKDVYPRVSSVLRKNINIVEKNDPIGALVKLYNSSKPSVLPVFDDGKFYGLLSIDDITSWFLNENASLKPVYNLTLSNIPSVIGGSLIRRGKTKEFTARLLAGAMDSDKFKETLEDTKEVVVVMGWKKEFFALAVKNNAHCIILTGIEVPSDDVSYEIEELSKDYEGSVFVTPLDTAECLRMLRMATEVSAIMKKRDESIERDMLFDDAKEALTSSDLRGLAVFDGDKYEGFVTRRCFLTRPRFNVILVDHNEKGQSILGIEDANIIEIIDHHRLDAPQTDLPIFIDSEPVGSTCTIIYNLYKRNNVIPSDTMAKIMLSGIIADTVILKSPTTTMFDVQATEELKNLCNEKDIQEFGKKMFSFTEPLSSRDHKVAIEGDFKEYRSKGICFGIGQCEISSFGELEDGCEQRLLETLEEVRKAHNLEWAMVLVTDVLHESSVLLSTNYKLSKKLSWPVRGDNSFLLKGVLSRKKQVLPEILRVVEES